jgi:hypothetical protein
MSYSDYGLSSEHRGALRKAKHQVNAGLLSFCFGGFLVIAPFVGGEMGREASQLATTRACLATGGAAFVGGIILVARGLTAESKVKKLISAAEAGADGNEKRSSQIGQWLFVLAGIAAIAAIFYATR